MIFNPRYLLVYRDWYSLLFITVLSVIGLVFIFSATYRPHQPYSLFFVKQCGGLIIGLVIYLVISCIDYRVMERWGYCAYWCVLVFLIFTLCKGSVGMGGQRWINLGLFKFQPSELAKLFFPPFASYQLYGDPLREKPSTHTYAIVLGVLVVSFLLIRKQPDLGTALIVLLSGLIMVWLAGLSRRFFIISFMLVAISAPITWHFLKEYQKKRIYVFLGYGDAHKERYQLEQAKIAIGSGGLTGKGLLRGTQNQLHFLPESRTDCIFAVIAEEWGLLGAIGIIILYMLFFLHLLYMTRAISDPGAQLLALGLLMPTMLSTAINISMIMGMLPVVGIPLPWISYGLSNLLTTMISFGWLESIIMRRLQLHQQIMCPYNKHQVAT